MQNKRKFILITFLFNLSFWICWFTFIMACRYYDIGKIAFVHQEINIPAARIYANGLGQGILVGIPYTLMELYLRKNGLYHYSLFRIIINRTLIQFGITALVLVFLAYINYRFDLYNQNIAPTVSFFRVYLMSATVQLVMLGALGGNLILSVFRTLQMKVGEDVFWDLLVGRFRPAQEEERAFLFIDLKSSTTIAEQLGHRDYSYFIQDCFRDLHQAVIRTKARIYQYVGDEAVLTWDTPTALEDHNCINAYFEFCQQLLQRENHYMSRYGLMPVFKAGLNIGKVMTAEVGVVKRDIAYHSDVLNTAARVQAKCNEKNAYLLATQYIVDMLDLAEEYQAIDKGEVMLRGKHQQVKIYEIRRS